MLVFQSFYGIPDTFADPQGRSVNAVLGFTLRLLELLDQSPQARVVLSWDESLGSGFRHRLFPAYKANRPLADAGFLYQLQRCAEIGDALGLPQRASEEFEADDLIAALVHWQHQAGGQAIIVSQDKDLAQIVTADDQWWPFPKSAPWSHDQLRDHWQIPLLSIADYLALCGDAVDNIPGVRGVGAVSARMLMQAFPSLELLFENADQMASLPVRGARRLRQKLETQREDVFLYRELTRLRTDALSQTECMALQNSAPNASIFEKILKDCNLWARVQKKAHHHFCLSDRKN